MNFVDDEDLVAIADRHDAQPRDDDLTNVVDLGVRGGIDLEHIDIASFGDLDAGVAGAARSRGRSLLAVQRARQDARGCGLADTARA